MLLAFPPLNLWPLLFVALVPWLWSLSALPNGRAAWRSGYCLGLVYGGGQLLWIAQFVGNWVGSFLIGLIPWFVACLLYALYFGWAGVLTWRGYAKGWLWTIPLTWAGIEVIRSYMPTFAFPWGLYATPLAEVPGLIQSAAIGTIFLVSALLIAFNVAVVELLRGQVRLAMAFGLTSVVTMLIPILLIRGEIGDPLQVVAIQPGVNLAFGDRDNRDLNLARSINELMPSGQEAGVDLVVLPEGMMNVPEMPPQPMFRLPEGPPVVFGGRRFAGNEKVYQTAFAYDGSWKYADKTRLVIFGEFVPGRDLFPFLAESFRLPSGDMVPGEDGVKMLQAGGLRIGPILCFEGLFPDIAARQAMNGAEVLSVMSIDDWYMGTMAPEQLRQASVWRAVETGIPLVRAASMGYTMGVQPSGQVVDRVDLAVPAAPQMRLERAQRRWNPAALFVFPILSLVAAVTMTLVVARKREPSGAARASS
jgi:apolipoprotein N-acyltransferase